METVRIVDTSIKVIYFNIGQSFGFYEAIPGEEPFICLNTSLSKIGSELHLEVYKALLQIHTSIPLDSWQRIFPITKYYEELINQEIYNPETYLFHKICGIMTGSKIPQKSKGFRVIGKV